MGLGTVTVRASLLAVLQAAVVWTATIGPRQTCRVFPGDHDWPSEYKWKKLENDVKGKLIETTPIGAKCYPSEKSYNEDACKKLTSLPVWTNPMTHINDPSSIMQPQFIGLGSYGEKNCDPYEATRSKQCALGNYASYAVEVENADHVAEAVKFANNENVRLVVRNTGHDYFGRSTGAGALSIWTHKLKSIKFIDHWDNDEGNDWEGAAVKVGAGVLGYEVLEAANKEGLVVVGGECPTVGLAGGYIQGGGHSALSTTFGLAADQTLEFEVVTAEGKIVKASPKQNDDLYWALSGGAPGTFGVVTSLTVRAYPAKMVGGATLKIPASDKNFLNAILKLHELIPSMEDQGASIIYKIDANGLVITAVTMFGKTEAEVKTVFAPFTQYLEAEKITKDGLAYTHLSYRDHYEQYLGAWPGTGNGHPSIPVEYFNFGGRLIPRATLEEGAKRERFVTLLNDLRNQGVTIVGTSVKAQAPDGVENAAHPAWRQAAIAMQIGTVWENNAREKMAEAQEAMTGYVNKLIEKTPGGGTYVNEADPNDPNWRENFFGSNIDRLEKIKKKWDPEGVFFGQKLPGSDRWTQNQDTGHLCRK